MAKKDKKDKLSDAVADTPAPEGAAAATEGAATDEKKASVPRTRGPRGVAEDAVITLLATANPKRTGSKAERAFSNYKSGMTIREFADILDADPELKGTSTGHLVYDAKHGFISIDGYDPGAIVTPKAKAPPKPRKEKASKVGGEEAGTSEAEAEAEVGAEQMA